MSSFLCHIPAHVVAKIQDLAQRPDSFSDPDLQAIISLWSHLARVVSVNSLPVFNATSLSSVHTETDEYHLTLGRLISQLEPYWE